MSKNKKNDDMEEIIEVIDTEDVSDNENTEDIAIKKKFNIWKLLFIVNMILTVACLGVSTLLMGKLAFMKLLPKRYFALAVVLLLIIPACSILLRKKKWATIIFIILNIAITLVVYKGYTMVDKADETIDKITEGGDVEVTVMEIRVLSSNNATEDSVLKEYTIGIMKEMDRKYADEVIKGLEESLGHKLSIKEYEDDITVLIKALYDKEIDAIIVNATYGEMLVEIEEYATFTTDTKVLKEVEIEEIIKKHDNAMSEAATENSTEEATGSSGNSDSGNGGGGYNYDWYLGQYGDDGGGFVYVEPTNPKEMSKDAFVVYISGIDTYGNVNRRCRSDVNILMAVNTKTKHVLMVNTPRDYYVPLSVSNGVRDKLTHAGNFGVNVSKDTLGMLYGVEAEYYVRMNFTGFIDIINAMGGVDVQSDYAFTSVSGYSFVKGMNYGIDGFKALAFARERKNLAAGDNQRGKHQMALISAMINKLASGNTLTNYNAIMNAIAGSFQTNFTSDEIYSLIHMQLDDMSAWTVESYSVTGKGKHDKTYSMPSVNAYVMEPNMDTVYNAREMIKKVLTEK
ncbi:MAG: LCP family protein [Lachnospiraceae bacterium]|nr:LCP family protein [Lachnospiraceae bacterium]